jgi:hypothetical protein
MRERLALLFSDASILVFPEGTKIEQALEEAADHDAGELSTSVVYVQIKINKMALLDETIAVIRNAGKPAALRAGEKRPQGV